MTRYFIRTVLALLALITALGLLAAPQALAEELKLGIRHTNDTGSRVVFQ